MKLIDKILKSEALSGAIIIFAMILAMIAENSPAKPFYNMLLDTPIKVQIGALIIAKPLLLWINDALMAIFFFLVGLELKRELTIGELSDKRKLVQPCFAAIAGIFIPALIYVALNKGNEVALSGWAIPTATDIAFALCILSLVGNAVPKELKIMLLSIAIIDDMGAIAIIGVFYSGKLSSTMLLLSVVAMGVLYLMNKKNVNTAIPYIFVGILLWIAILKSGVHATLAGIIVAMFIPLKSSGKNKKSMLIRLENDLHGFVAYIILPIFAFANSGISLDGFSFSKLFEPIPLGIIIGLVIGKQVGVFGGIWAATRITKISLTESITWSQIYGVSALCGIGFTMSLFISGLAFDDPSLSDSVRIGILTGSIISAAIGYSVLKYCSIDNPPSVNKEEPIEAAKP